MKLTQLRDLVAIVKHGSLRSAARHLELAQPALTRSIRTLERELGVTLFEREVRGICERFRRPAKQDQEPRPVADDPRPHQRIGGDRRSVEGRISATADR